ncbi:uncharacterized protein LOC120630728 [Pararge aegeria]|uniref:uncharacterized protein LOC120630728 n=1 Tax=Pararge aegeria TaxID=116150 RepID=UPI0019D0FF18|nr:uncharacterized protein LOC120630728 [Pararge aegeria]
MGQSQQHTRIWKLQRDMTAVVIKSGLHQGMNATPKPVVLASLYMPIEQQIPPKELTDLITHCEVNNKDLIISVDSNAHHNLWGSTTNNKRGEQLVSYLLTTNLTILNKGTEPTFVSSRYQTIIDLTLATIEISDQVKNWHVSDEPTLSDHRRICYELDLIKTQWIPKRNPRKTNRQKYRELLKNKTDAVKPTETHSCNNIEENVTTVTKHITTSYE